MAVPQLLSEVQAEFWDLFSRNPYEAAEYYARKYFEHRTMLCRVAVSLTAAGQTTLFDPPEGYKCYIDEVCLEGKTAQSGTSKQSTLKIGRSPSYNQLLNGSGGHTFDTTIATTLLDVVERLNTSDLYTTATMSGMALYSAYNAGETLIADVSTGGTILDAGEVWVELHGRLYRKDTSSTKWP